VRLRTSVHRITSIEDKLWSAAYLYLVGNAGTGSTYRHNLEALEQWRIVPRMLRNSTHRNLEVSTVLPLPVTEPTASAPRRPPSLASSCLRPYSYLRLEYMVSYTRMLSLQLRAQPQTWVYHSSCRPRVHAPSKQWPRPTATGTAGINYIGTSRSPDHAFPLLQASEQAAI
jgi:hypothetical protein